MENKRKWFVDCNDYDGMMRGSSNVVREDNNNNNGVNDGLMVIGVNEINNHCNGGLSFDDAILISACPDMLYALKLIIEKGLTCETLFEAQQALKKAGH